MNQTTKASKHFPITNKNRPERMRAFLLSQPESEQSWPPLAGCVLTPHLLLTQTGNHSQRPYHLANGVFACLPVAGERVDAFWEMNPMTAGNTVKRWAKQRLWDRPLGRSKLRQQGSPTIFVGRANPTILPISTLHSRETGVAATHGGRPVVPAFTRFLRGNHGR